MKSLEARFAEALSSLRVVSTFILGMVFVAIPLVLLNDGG